MKYSLLPVAWLLTIPALAADSLVNVPNRFVGHWAGSPESCGAYADELILRLTPDHIWYWESEGPVKAVVVHGNTEIALINELHGEGENWLSTAQFTLSRDGLQLIDNTTVPGKALVRYKCPNKSSLQNEE